MTDCIKLNRQYREAYHDIKNRKEGREKQEFSFSEQYIFGRFDYFCTRLQNILTMFSKIKLFTMLFKNRLENLLAWELIDDDSKYFDAAVKFLKQKEYDFLDFRNTQFDKDYNDFMVRTETLTDRLRVELEKAYDDIWGTPHSFQYISRFQKLTSIFAIGGMKDKYTRVILCFQSEIEAVMKFFKKQQNKAPIPRMYPETAGKIYWVRSLLYHMKYYIDHFQANDSFLKIPEYRKLVKQYNDAGVMLMKYELTVQDTFKNFKIHQIENMIALPIMKIVNGSNTIAVNFDPILNLFLQENQKLCKLDIPLPSVNKFLIKRKPWFHEFRDMIEMVLTKYYSITSLLAQDLKRLFYPHLSKLKASLDPGFSEFNWTSYHWEDFTGQVLDDIHKFGNVVQTANDIYNNRVEKTLQSMTELELYELPTKEPWSLEIFLDKVKEKCVFAARELQRKSLMVEEAVEDLINLATEANPRRKEEEEIFKDPYKEFLTVIDRHQGTSVTNAAKDVRKIYCNVVSSKLISLIRKLP